MAFRMSGWGRKKEKPKEETVVAFPKAMVTNYQIVHLKKLIESGWGWDAACSRAGLCYKYRFKFSISNPMLREVRLISLSNSKGKAYLLERFKKQCEQFDSGGVNVFAGP